MSNDTSTLPDINNIPFALHKKDVSKTKTPLSISYSTKLNKNNDGEINCGRARSMIQARLKKLQEQKQALNSIKQNFQLYNGDLTSQANLRTLANEKGRLANPNLYQYQFMDPIYYPLDMPISAEPVTLPKIEMGHPMSKKCHDGMGIEDLLALLLLMRRKNKPQVQPAPQIIIPPMPQPAPVLNPITVPGPNLKPIIPNPNKTDIGRGLKRDWWRLARDFVNLYIFFSTANKYAKFAKVRSNLIQNRMKSIVQEISVLKEWIISIEEPFWNEFKVFQDLDVTFTNIDSNLKKSKESQKIVALMRIYLENLIKNSTRLPDIPERVQRILYDYIKERAYFPKRYLSTFQINRIDFNFYGGTRLLDRDQYGMLVAFLLISGVTVQQILLHMKDSFVEFKNYPNIDKTGKFIGSLLHYLTRDTFKNNPTMVRELLALLNYYRNYHLYNAMVEKQKDIFNTNMNFLDADEFSEFLVPENRISDFWNINGPFIDLFKNHVYSWAKKLGENIRLKFQKDDVNLLPKRTLQRPMDKTVSYELQ